MDPIRVRLKRGRVKGRIVDFRTSWDGVNSDVLAVVVWDDGKLSADDLVDLIALDANALWPAEKVTA